MISFLSLYASDNSPGILRTFFRSHKDNSHRSSDQPMGWHLGTIANVSHNSARDVGCTEERSSGAIVFSRREYLDDRDSCLSWTRANGVFAPPFLLVLKSQPPSVPLHPDACHLYFDRLQDPITLSSQRLPFLPSHLLEKIVSGTTLDRSHTHSKSQ